MTKKLRLTMASDDEEEIPAVSESESEGKEGDEEYEQLPKWTKTMPQPITIRKCRWDPLPLPLENWYETVQSLQAGKIWAFVPKLVLYKGPVYVFHPTIAWKPEVTGANDYYVSGCDEYTKWLVNNFQIYGTLQGRNVSLDRYFTRIT